MKTTPPSKTPQPGLAFFVRIVAALCLLGALVTGPAARAIVSTNVYVSSSAPWHGWMNWYGNWTDYTNGVTSPGGSSAWGTALLPAVFNPTYAAATLSPNTSVYNVNDPYWVNPDGTGAKIMEANFYVDDDGLTNKLIVFSGYCWANTLSQPYYAKAFVKVFDSTYSTFVAQTNKLVAVGQAFSISVFAPSGSHPQYGFFTVGPDANPATVSSLGYALISSNPLPTSVTIATPPQNTYALIDGKATFSVLAFGSNLTYRWQKDGVNLSNSSQILGATSATLVVTNITKASEALYTVVVSDGTTSASASAQLTVVDPNHLTVDFNAPWLAYMNWYANNANTMGAYIAGGNWSATELRANFGNGVMTLAPNTNVYNPTDSYWVNPDGSGAKFMEALFFQEWDGLGGQYVTFTGYCPSYTLVPPYTARAYIREFLPDYSAYDEATITLIGGQSFTVSKSTGAGDHVQWGFATSGPDANPATVASLGRAEISAVNPPSLTAVKNGVLVNLSFPTETGYSYIVKYKTNLTSGFWQALSTSVGTGSTVTVQDVPAATPRFYALFIQ